MIISVTRKNLEIFNEWVTTLERHMTKICKQHEPLDTESFNVLIVSYDDDDPTTIHGFMTIVTKPDDNTVHIKRVCAPFITKIKLISFVVDKSKQNNKHSIQIEVHPDDEHFWMLQSFDRSVTQTMDDLVIMERKLISTLNEAFAYFLKHPPSTSFPTNDDLSYLPPLPRSDASATQFEEKVHNIITGTVARSTTEARWGMNIDGQSVGTFEDPTFKLYTISEIDPTDPTQTYSVYYIYLTQSASYESFKLFKKQTACGKTLTKVLERSVLAVENLKKSGLYSKDLSYETSTLFAANRYWNEPDKMIERGLWVSLLGFSSDCSNTAVILSTTIGSIQDFPVALYNDFKPAEKIKVPYFNLVGNIETISAHGLKYKQDFGVDNDTDEFEPDTEMRREAHRLNKIRTRYKEDQKADIPASIQTGSCTLNMALTMMVLRSLKYDVMYLENAGDIPGCKCYSTAASANEMFSLVFKSDDLLLYPLDKVSRGDGTQLQTEKYKLFRLFNSMHCDPKTYFVRTVKRAEESDIHAHNYMFFIDRKKLTDIYRLFKKLEYLQRKKIPFTVSHILESMRKKSPTSKKRKHE